ncbi:MAG: PhzF family phenazine biosynthesis protein [Lysobacterales bacterium]|jgi:PhzF family phenazine biosynthesis protein
MSTRRFAQIDVFTARAGYGNPVAVVLDADGLDSAAMQRLAAWTNLSETAFVLAPTSPQADFRVRIFTPRQELPFAGHPAVGSAYALLDARAQWQARERLTLECAAGLLAVRVEGAGAQRRIFVQAPAARLAVPAHELVEGIERALHVRPLADPLPRLVDNGPRWLIAQLEDAGVVRSLQPDYAATAALTAHHGAVGLCVFGREPAGAMTAIAVRAFCPGDGIPEDPVTGSANAAIGAFLHANGALEQIGWRYRASQGREVGRDGFVDVEIDPHTGAVAIGGHCVSCIVGQLNFGDRA